MPLFAPRAGPWPLARSLAALGALGALGACADEPAGPKTPSTPQASVQSLGGDGLFTVTNTSGGTDVGSLRWAAAQLNATNGGTIEFDPTSPAIPSCSTRNWS
jgi:hypothetical protein